MISIEEEENPTIFSIWLHSVPGTNGECLSASKIKLWALQYAEKSLQNDLNEIQNQINAITNKTTTTELSKNASSINGQSAA